MRFLFLTACLLIAAVPVAAEPAFPDTGPPDAAVVVADATAPAILAPGDDVILKEVVGDVVKVITDPAPVSALVIVALLIAILVKLTKLGAVARLLEGSGKAWLRPLIAAALGGAGALVTALTAGTRDAVGLVAAFVAGAWAGFSAAGSVDAARVAFFPATRKKESADGAALEVAAIELERRLTDAPVTLDIERQVEDARRLPVGQRVDALAALLRDRR